LTVVASRQLQALRGRAGMLHFGRSVSCEPRAVRRLAID
jgi:hypothetical protein